MQSSLQPTNISKIHLHVEHFSLRAGWRLAERLFTTKAGRKIHAELSRKGQEAIRSGPVLLGGTQKRREITWMKIPSEESVV